MGEREEVLQRPEQGCLRSQEARELEPGSEGGWGRSHGGCRTAVPGEVRTLDSHLSETNRSLWRVTQQRHRL